MGTYILEALSLICTPLNLFCLFAATFLGLIVGMLPGLTSTMAVALLTGLFTPSKNKAGTILCSAAGLAICHLLGALQFMLLMKMGFVESLMLVSVPYLLKDVISVVAAFVVGAAVRKALNAANILTYA